MFDDPPNTFLLIVINIGVGHVVVRGGLMAQQVERKEGRKEMFYLTTHSTHFIYGYMASDI